MGLVVVQLISYSCGKALARWLSTKAFRIWKYQFSLNLGPFNQKEHMLISIIAGVTLDDIAPISLLLTQISSIFFNQPWARSLLYQYSIQLSLLFLGYELGLVRMSLIYLDFYIWQSLLPIIAFNRSLHEENGYLFRLFGISFTRYRYLLAVSSLIFVWTM